MILCYERWKSSKKGGLGLGPKTGSFRLYWGFEQAVFGSFGLFLMMYAGSFILFM